MSKTFVKDELMKMLVRHEGLRLKPYTCQAGKLTIGVGRNLTDFGINKIEALALLANDIERVEDEAPRLITGFNVLNDARKIAIMDMLFNLGETRFRNFKKFIQLVQVRDFDSAAKEMLNSLWANQVGRRAVELAEIIKTGILNTDVRMN